MHICEGMVVWGDLDCGLRRVGLDWGFGAFAGGFE